MSTGTTTSPPAPTATPAPMPPAGPPEQSPDDAENQPGNGAGTGVPSPEFGTLEDWLTGYFLPMFRRTLGGEYRWCRQWWRHGEAISRLTALWHSWEVLRTQPGTGIATWYRDHLDHQLPILLGARGPFYQCSQDTHREPHQHTTDPAPPGWWHPAGPEAALQETDEPPGAVTTGGSHHNHTEDSGAVASDGA